MTARKSATIVGIAFLLIGIIGFFKRDFLGMHLSTVHNCIHIGSGLLAFYIGTSLSDSASSKFLMIFGAIYLSLGILGFISPDVVGKILHAGHARMMDMGEPNLAPDNTVHIVLGSLFLILGFFQRPKIAVGM